MTEIVEQINIDKLPSYLVSFGIPIQSWGSGDAKTILHLQNELQENDCELIVVNGKLIRRVSFVNISVTAEFDGSLHNLVEKKQVFDEGTKNERVRMRTRIEGSVKEKIHISEDPTEAATRAIGEELGIDNTFPKLISSKDIEEESPSYPGLPTQYHAYYYQVTLEGKQININGYKELRNGITSYFVWK